MNTTITDLFPVNSTIHDSAFKDFINNSIGYFLELVEEEVEAMKDGCFIDTAEGKYLDLWGKDYNIPRLQNEDDEAYRVRLKILPLEHFSISTIYEAYDLQLLSYSSLYEENMLLSDNHFLNNRYFVDCSDEVWEDLNKKFIVDYHLERLPNE